MNIKTWHPSSKQTFSTWGLWSCRCRDCQLQPSRRVRNLQPDSELCRHCHVHPLFTARRYVALFFLPVPPVSMLDRITNFKETIIHKISTLQWHMQVEVFTGPNNHTQTHIDLENTAPRTEPDLFTIRKLRTGSDQNPVIISHARPKPV